MKYAAIIEYLQDAEKVQAIRPTHREYLTKLKAAGQLALAGPFADGSGALIVYEAESPEAAEALLRADPFYASGVFLKWQLRPWNTVFANRELLPE
jgi:uncharacterized protein YciI